MDRVQLLLFGLPLFLLFSDLVNLFTPPPAKPASHHPLHHHHHHQQSPSPAVVQTLDVPVQRPVIGGIGIGGTVKIDFCSSCSYKGTAASMTKMLENQFPGVEVILANYPAPLPKRVVSKLVPVLQFGVIAVVGAGEHIFPMVGIMTPPTWYHTLRANKFGTMASAWLIGNTLQSFLQGSGAFEVYCNNELVFSKLKEGRFPGEIELRELVGKALTRTSISNA
ncbi:SelT-like protein [Linum grandiflorum]